MEQLFDISVLQRKEEYYNGLETRLTFPVRDGRSLLIHTSGVSFEGRQDLLKAAAIYCKLKRSPLVKLEKEPDNVYDKFAIKVLLALNYDDTTGDPIFSHVGYIPKGRCPYCATTLSGQKSSSQICKECNSDISIRSSLGLLKTLNRYLSGNFDKLKVGVDTVTTSTSGLNLGLDIWVRIEVSEPPV